MIVKDYKNNGERIAYTLDYDIFSVNVEHKKTSEGVDVTDLKGLFDWLDEQEVSKVPLESFLSFQNSLSVTTLKNRQKNQRDNPSFLFPYNTKK